MKKPNLTNTAAASNGDAKAGAALTTGRHIVVFRSDANDAGIKVLEAAGLKVAVSDSDVLKEDSVGDADVIVFPRLGVAVVSGDVDTIVSLATSASDSASPIKTVREEKVFSAIETSIDGGLSAVDTGSIPAAYLQGYRSAIDNLVDTLKHANTRSASTPEPVAASSWDESRATWGLQVTGAAQSRYSGNGVRVAVLDTGIDFSVATGPDGRPSIMYHPDFQGRSIVGESFVPGAPTAKDGNGHGTHCIGTACGPLNPSSSTRYGIAHQADIYVGKVLNDSGRGAEAWILAGIEWAIRNRCPIVSLSLGFPVEPGDAFDPSYESVARRALAAGTLLIAAAGNDSQRPGVIAPVEGPANCPSVLAVGAVYSVAPGAPFGIPPFSNGAVNPNGGEVNIAAPGVNIYSSYRMPTGHARLQGTSMATPHVAGIAALYAQGNPGVVGRGLWDLMIRNAHSLPFQTTDVGSGLVQAP